MIVCLCGSTKFKEEFMERTREETLAGNIVLSVGFFGHADDTMPDRFTKAKLDLLHLKKIEMADVVFVVNVDGYIGESTERELVHAINLGKDIEFWDPIRGENYLDNNGCLFKEGKWTLA